MSFFGPTAVYLLCLITSAVCAVLLARAWRANRSRLLLWTAISFALLAVNNLFLVADLVWLPDVYLLPYRRITAFAALGVLLYGFVWETDR